MIQSGFAGNIFDGGFMEGFFKKTLVNGIQDLLPSFISNRFSTHKGISPSDKNIDWKTRICSSIKNLVLWAMSEPLGSAGKNDPKF